MLAIDESFKKFGHKSKLLEEFWSTRSCRGNLSGILGREVAGGVRQIILERRKAPEPWGWVGMQSAVQSKEESTAVMGR